MITDRIFEARGVRLSIIILASEAHFRSYIVCSGMDTPIDRFENTLKWNLYETGTFFPLEMLFSTATFTENRQYIKFFHGYS